MTGQVYLVGAGLENIAYLTLRAYHLLSHAEVLIYDALIDSQLLNLVPYNCLKINVGKRGGLPSTKQETINKYLVDYCLEGKQVVRLKSGDPLIFGRVNPEINALIKANCNYELVPGISSALAAPLLAGIPLTDKVLSRCFTVLTGHQPDLLDWEALAKIDTLVILMGGRTLSIIIQCLQDKGLAITTPIAIIRHSGNHKQQVWLGTLGDILDKVYGVSLSPAVIIIGEVVTLKFMDFSSFLPLTNKTILVTRAAEQSSQFTLLLQQQGATVIEMPALEIVPPSSWEGLDSAIKDLSTFNWLILTSANAVEFFFKRLDYYGKDARALSEVKIAVVGKKTASVLQNYGLKPDFIPPNFVADSLVENFPESLSHQNILFPRVETGGREILVKELTKFGANVVEVAAYQSGCPSTIDTDAWDRLQSGKIDIITFASSKTVENFYQLVQQALEKESSLRISAILEKICIASIGPQTSKTCYERLGRVDIEAVEYTLEGLVEALIKSYCIVL
ncbi:uroporphyrinogen-III C-methyltransferase [Aphanothece sacrum]|uniref:uroporphyrinogen-III C-methyltransferase n=1 Tax=Aphanothece sacrum FPU1 TaxID=1920663 RepID=A0A401IGJ2_APHSA|nr:uroporphyrinogen-III C-methyltransferase [Aphanothece sacrum]GBF80310.1 hypothetical protein AsFPU1_1711 [Aphanothece sacrum FPU1]GBF83716.1 hypothetical protein AsFPU3_0759 [Aphanothece sacrum FPU3]